MSSRQLQHVVKLAGELQTAEQLELIRHVAEHLARQHSQGEPSRVSERRYLEYGKYRASGFGRPSTEEDFKLAEWRPNNEDLHEY